MTDDNTMLPLNPSTPVKTREAAKKASASKGKKKGTARNSRRLEQKMKESVDIQVENYNDTSDLAGLEEEEEKISTLPEKEDLQKDPNYEDVIFPEEEANLMTKEQNDALVNNIEQEVKDHKNKDKKSPKSAKKEKPDLDVLLITVSHSYFNGQKQVEEMLTKMHSAIQKDFESNKKGKPCLQKLLLVNDLISSLKIPTFSEIFLNSKGLETINNFITMLPDGTWPLSTVRSKLLKCIYQLPVNVYHLRSSRIGKTLTLLQANKKEFLENKNMIQLIKDKWSRIICGLTVEYTNLEEFERNIAQIPIFTRDYVDEDGSFLGKRMVPMDQRHTCGIPKSEKPKNYGFSFTVRPQSVVNLEDTKKRAKKRSGSKSNITRYLSKIRKQQKFM